jgi:membrane-associated phospholipid phosphatase
VDSSAVTSLNHAFNGSGAGQAFVRWFTTLPLVAILILLVWAWVKEWARTTQKRTTLALGIGAALLGVAVCALIAHLWPRARPWTVDSLDIHQIIGYARGSSFPTAQLAAAGALAIALLEVRPSFGIASFVLAALSGVARIASGNSYPSDVIVGLVIGIVCFLAALPLRKPATVVVGLAARFESLAVPRRPENAPTPHARAPKTEE